MCVSVIAVLNTPVWSGLVLFSHPQSHSHPTAHNAMQTANRINHTARHTRCPEACGGCPGNHQITQPLKFHTVTVLFLGRKREREICCLAESLLQMQEMGDMGVSNGTQKAKKIDQRETGFQRLGFTCQIKNAES